MTNLLKSFTKTSDKGFHKTVDSDNLPEHVLVIGEVFNAAKNALRFLYVIKTNLEEEADTLKTENEHYKKLVILHHTITEIFKLLRQRELYYTNGMKTFMTLLFESLSASQSNSSYMNTLNAKNFVMEHLRNFITVILPFKETKRETKLGDFYQYIHKYLILADYEQIQLLINALNNPPSCKTWDTVEIPVRKNVNYDDRKHHLLMYMYYLITRNVILENRISISPIITVNFHKVLPDNRLDIESYVAFKAKMVIPNMVEVRWAIPDRVKYEVSKLKVQSIYIQAAIRDSLTILNEASIAYRNFSAEHFLMYPNEVLTSTYKHILLTDFRRAVFYGSIPTERDTYDQMYHFNDAMYTTISEIANIEDCIIWLSNIQTSIKLDLSAITDPKYMQTVISQLREQVQEVVVKSTQMEIRSAYYEIMQMLIDMIPKNAVIITTIKLRSLETSPLMNMTEPLSPKSSKKSPTNRKNQIANFLKLSKQFSNSSLIPTNN